MDLLLPDMLLEAILPADPLPEAALPAISVNTAPLQPNGTTLLPAADTPADAMLLSATVTPLPRGILVDTVPVTVDV